ncbi:hypothetical protein CC1G_13143 [Coprinopsis cinerea okayama7|uniref:Uncharacterized protein n=1 Tax=Coprinopsis cinerea (strain Okayama-7 / 130 / ATCC MYA-4618 / FGSC 9003) TaxID=240176 RepID=A8PF94_COPC7|nr:hypothetical protein CC1G_13143 [Coprinopsis cinerea okayama7\|eukprot:XP_001840960.2 hypothetical protein CC1G_13143 [Coprinopsis cinerea okayama7\
MSFPHATGPKEQEIGFQNWVRERSVSDPTPQAIAFPPRTLTPQREMHAGEPVNHDIRNVEFIASLQ